jgi:hypothetical protein
MTKATAETFITLCDALVADPGIANACRVARIGESTYWRWIAECAQDPTKHVFEFGEYGAMNFAQAVHLTQKIAVAILHAEALRKARHGNKRIKTFQGKVMYQERLDIPPDLTPDEMEICYGVRDRYTRDDDGNLIPLMEWEPPSDAIILGVLQKLGGSAWRDTKDVNVKMSGGVMVVGNKSQPQIPHQPPDQKMIEQLAREIVEEVGPGPEILEPDIGEDSGPPVMNAEPPVPPEPEPTEMITTGDPIPMQAAPSTMSPMRAALLRELEKTKDPYRPTAKPTAPINTGLPPKHRDDPA